MHVVSHNYIHLQCSVWGDVEAIFAQTSECLDFKVCPTTYNSNSIIVLFVK